LAAGGKGSIKVDLTTLNSSVAKRDQDMQQPQYLKLTAEQVEAQKRFAFSADNLKVEAKFGTPGEAERLPRAPSRIC